MIGLILAAGKGSRLGQHTTDLPKSLLPLNADGTLLDYNIKILHQLKVDRIVIVTGFNTQKIEDHIQKYDDVSIIYNPFWNVCNVLGSLYMALQKIDEDFLFLHADTIVEQSVWEKMKEHPGEIVMPYKRKVCGEEEMKVVIDEAGNLLEINKTMDAAGSDGEFLGIAKFSKTILPDFISIAKQLFMTGKLDFYMEAAVQEAIDAKMDIKAFDIGEAKFVEVDFEEDYLLAKDIFKA